MRTGRASCPPPRVALAGGGWPPELPRAPWTCGEALPFLLSADAWGVCMPDGPRGPCSLDPPDASTLSRALLLEWKADSSGNVTTSKRSCWAAGRLQLLRGQRSHDRRPPAPGQDCRG